MHVHFRRGILQPLVTQHAKARQKKQTCKKNKQTMHRCGECKGKGGTANHFETELNPQVPPVRNVLTRDQETN